MLNQLFSCVQLYVPSEGLSADHCVCVAHKRIAPNDIVGQGTCPVTTSGCRTSPRYVFGTTELTGTQPVPDNVTRCGESAASLMTIRPPLLAAPVVGS